MITDISEILNFRFDVRAPKQMDWMFKQGIHSGYPKNFSTYKKLLQSPPHVFNYFRYILKDPKDPDSVTKINKQPKNNDVLCYSTGHILACRSLVDSTSENYGNLAIMGNDVKLYRYVESLELIKHRFTKIYCEAKDIECDWVQVLPMGMIMAYMVRNGGNDILYHINKQKNKTKLVSSAFGSRWPTLNWIPDRSALIKYIKQNNFVDNMFCEPDKYYERLCEYKFFLSPLGNGIQTPKICECIMCETVPVVTDHVAHRELRDLYGLPLLIVDDWSCITKNMLNEQWELVYKNTNWSEQKNKFLVKNFKL